MKTKEEIREANSRGGKNRFKGMTKKQRSEYARKIAKIRWDKPVDNLLT